MIQLRNKRVAVLGLRASGLAMARFAQSQGAQVKAFGILLPERFEDAKKSLKGAPIELVATDTLPVNIIKEFDLIILTNIYREYVPFILAAQVQGVEILTDLELASMFPRGKLIAIAGSNGKSSTALTLKAIFDNQGKKSRILGGEFLSIGEALKDTKTYDYDILIADSLKLKWSENFHPHIAALINIYPGAREKHENFDDYGMSMSRVFAKQEANDFLIYQNSQDVVYYLKKVGTKAQCNPFSLEPFATEEGAYFSPQGIKLVYFFKDAPPEEFPINPKVRRYVHKTQDTIAAVYIAKVCNCSHEVIQTTIDELRSFPHRLEWFKTLNGVKYYDDSRARNLAATLFALLSFEGRNLILIAGGEYMSQQFYKDLVPMLKSKVKCLIITGDSRGKFFKHWGEGVEKTYLVATLEDAVQLAYRIAEKKDKVLFSPASRAELHLFANSYKRGEAFKKLVDELEEFSNARKGGAPTKI
jgi:UDP-N-acetylmuramoylalanine--D-glutamate ligase